VEVDEDVVAAVLERTEDALDLVERRARGLRNTVPTRLTTPSRTPPASTTVDSPPGWRRR
jgi:hypothetical protein